MAKSDPAAWAVILVSSVVLFGVGALASRWLDRRAVLEPAPYRKAHVPESRRDSGTIDSVLRRFARAAAEPEGGGLRTHFPRVPGCRPESGFKGTSVLDPAGSVWARGSRGNFAIAVGRGSAGFVPGRVFPDERTLDSAWAAARP